MSRNKTKDQTPVTPATNEIADEQEQTPVVVAEAKPPKQTPAERKAARLADEAATRARGEVVKNAAGRPTARGLTCLCGCADATHRPDAWFRSGHDARLRKAVITGSLTFDGLPEIVKPFFKLMQPIAGLLLADDGSTILDVKAGGGGLDQEYR